ncbi:MAG TPA: 2-dehydropantoate 2-reductase [Steroidobacteraceae bacterium]|nr:2-dehydropantoate 2-reductase [Steroidobacteraceae bacterium]
MRIAIVGCGAIGGYVGAKLALAGEQITFIVRGANLEALRHRGLRLIPSDGPEQHLPEVAATDDYHSAGAHDLVILAVKAHQLEAIAAEVPRLCGAATPVVTMQNGIPYWYFHRHGGELAGSTVRSVDPHGLLARMIPAERVIGCVVYPAAELVAPGIVRHIEGTRFPVGELDGSRSERVLRISECFTRAGFKAPVLEDIRAEIWLKLWGNLTFNPISALTRATLADICQFAPTRALAAAMMTEAQTIAEKLGVRFRVGLEQRIAGAERVGQHKTSMLQDVEAGRAPELEALVGSVVELGQLTRTHTPHIDAVYALARLLLRTVAAPAQERTGAPHGPAAHVVASGAQGPSPVAWAEGVR